LASALIVEINMGILVIWMIWVMLACCCFFYYLYTVRNRKSERLSISSSMELLFCTVSPLLYSYYLDLLFALDRL